ncbi:MAG TPA: hypothetical protein DCZ69_05280 [Syntrophobacteraceae bacterium]|nr:hypothetical protein [Syntrophobacteraceae bacterium]HBD07652.1 hypothetical protein [Syntrophobacteraceae bacterium]HBZ53878.1 hypothetical protein [Syntrophobacteraceae bacterium]
MTWSQAVAWRDVLGKLGTLWCILLAVSLLDAVTAKFRESPLVSHVMPGEVIQLTNPVGEPNAKMDDLVIVGNTPTIAISVDAIRPSFWFGGAMWHARVEVSSTAAAGDYPIRIYPRGVPEAKVPAHHVIVHADQQSYYGSSTSFIRRFLRYSPWQLAAIWALCVVATLSGLYLLSRFVDRLMALEGRASIYLVRSVDDGQEILFGLGSKHGVETGRRVDVLDGSGHWVGFGEVRKVDETDALAWVQTDVVVIPGFTVISR